MMTRSLPLEKRMKLYNEALQIRKEFGFGGRRISKLLGINQGVIDSWLYNNSCPEWNRIKFVPNTSKELSYVFGVILGDACLWKNKYNHCFIELKSKDRDFVELFSSCMAKLFNKDRLNYTQHTYDGYWKVQYGSREFYNFVKSLSITNILDYTKTNQEAFLMGLYDSEGSVHVQASNNFDISIGLSNVNKGLLKSIFEILKNNFRINSYIVRVKEKGSLIEIKKPKYFRNKDVWRLQIHGLNCIKIFTDKIGFSIKRKQEKLKDAIKIIGKFSRREACIIWKTKYKIIGREWSKISFSNKESFF